ncbi:PLXB2-like protein [Mya arenaria]|uniref:PLXB2-like protein n=1 Tax=Mya arenaria TaxID=6604 RepID=A0ABY7GB80_MYAAR|nr:PLXB2-like protein [Mya arenaria]
MKMEVQKSVIKRLLFFVLLKLVVIKTQGDRFVSKGNITGTRISSSGEVFVTHGNTVVSLSANLSVIANITIGQTEKCKDFGGFCLHTIMNKVSVVDILTSTPEKTTLLLALKLENETIFTVSSFNNSLNSNVLNVNFGEFSDVASDSFVFQTGKESWKMILAKSVDLDTSHGMSSIFAVYEIEKNVSYNVRILDLYKLHSSFKFDILYAFKHGTNAYFIVKYYSKVYTLDSDKYSFIRLSLSGNLTEVPFRVANTNMSFVNANLHDKSNTGKTLLLLYKDASNQSMLYHVALGNLDEEMEEAFRGCEKEGRGASLYWLNRPTNCAPDITCPCYLLKNYSEISSAKILTLAPASYPIFIDSDVLAMVVSEERQNTVIFFLLQSGVVLKVKYGLFPDILAGIKVKAIETATRLNVTNAALWTTAEGLYARFGRKLILLNTSTCTMHRDDASCRRDTSACVWCRQPMSCVQEGDCSEADDKEVYMGEPPLIVYVRPTASSLVPGSMFRIHGVNLDMAESIAIDIAGEECIVQRETISSSDFLCVLLTGVPYPIVGTAMMTLVVDHTTKSQNLTVSPPGFLEQKDVTVIPSGGIRVTLRGSNLTSLGKTYIYFKTESGKCVSMEGAVCEANTTKSLHCFTPQLIGGDSLRNTTVRVYLSHELVPRTNMSYLGGIIESNNVNSLNLHIVDDPVIFGFYVGVKIADVYHVEWKEDAITFVLKGIGLLNVNKEDIRVKVMKIGHVDVSKAMKEELHCSISADMMRNNKRIGSIQDEQLLAVTVAIGENLMYHPGYIRLYSLYASTTSSSAPPELNSPRSTKQSPSVGLGLKLIVVIVVVVVVGVVVLGGIAIFIYRKVSDRSHRHKFRGRLDRNRPSIVSYRGERVYIENPSTQYSHSPSNNDPSLDERLLSGHFGSVFKGSMIVQDKKKKVAIPTDAEMLAGGTSRETVFHGNPAVYFRVIEQVLDHGLGSLHLVWRARYRTKPVLRLTIVLFKLDLGTCLLLYLLNHLSTLANHDAHCGTGNRNVDTTPTESSHTSSVGIATLK